MPLGSRHRLTGLLKQSARGFILEMDGGGVWALDVGGKANPMLGRRVTVEGVRSGFDRIDVDWLGAADRS